MPLKRQKEEQAHLGTLYCFVGGVTTSREKDTPLQKKLQKINLRQTLSKKPSDSVGVAVIHQFQNLDT